MLRFGKRRKAKTWRSVRGFLRDSNENTNLRERFVSAAQTHLKARPELLDAFTPSFPHNCRRQTQSPANLEAITAPKVTYITSPIKHLTERGIQTQDGMMREILTPYFVPLNTKRIIRCSSASGLMVGSCDSSVGWEANQVSITYLGICTPGFPNLLFMHGPHLTSPSGTVPYSFETQLTYIAKLFRRVSMAGIRSVDVSSAAANDFLEYSDIFFNTTVLTDECLYSYKRNEPNPRFTAFGRGVRRISP